MARGELLRKLFLSFQRGQKEEFRAIALQIIAEEEKKKNQHLAKELLNIINYSVPMSPFNGFVPNNVNSVPKDKEHQTLLVDVREPKRGLEDIILRLDNRALIERILREYRNNELLRLHGLKPKSKLLLCGPPGCGKTLCAEVIASELGLPLLYSRFDSIISSYLGETAANLRKVFDYAASNRWVVLFDEFDAIGKARDDVTEHGELKRVVNSFLQLLDNFSAPSIIIAATNHEKMLDPALWRRFDDIIFFPKPNVHEIKELIQMKLKNFPYRGLDLVEIADKLRGMSHSDIEHICFDAIKSAILNDVDIVDEYIFLEAYRQQRERETIVFRALGAAKKHKTKET